MPDRLASAWRAADLVPELKAHADLKADIICFVAFVVGVTLTLVVKFALEP